MTNPLRSIRVLLLMAIVGGIFLVGLNWGSSPDTRYGIVAMVNGTADKPFVTRALLPLIIRGLMLLPGVTITSATAFVTLIGFIAFVFAFGWLVSSVGLEVRLRHYAIALLGLIPFLLGVTHIYDLGTLALFPAAIAAMQQRRWKLYLVLFTLACINRETAFLLVLLYAVYEWPQQDSYYWPMVFFQSGLFLAIRGGILTEFASNPGGPIEIHWAEHLPALLAKMDYASYAACFIGIVIYLAFQHFRDKPRILITSAFIFLPVLTVAYFIIGVPFEFRIFFEVYPIILLLAMYPTTAHYRAPELSEKEKAALASYY